MTSLTLSRETKTALNANAPIDVVRFMTVFTKHIRMFSLIFFFVVFAVLFLTLSQPPRYTASATLLINQHTPDVLHINAVTTQEAGLDAPTVDSSAVDTQVALLNSRALASSVVDQLGLENDPEFNARLRRGPAAPVNSALGEQRIHERVVSAVLKGLNVKRQGATYAIDLDFTALQSVKAQQIANAFLQNYLTQNLNAKVDESHDATSWLDTRLAQLQQDVQKANAAVGQYKIQNNLMTAAGPTTLTEQEIMNVDSQLAQARAQQAAQDAKLKTAQAQLAAGSNGGDVGEALNSPVIGALRTQRAQQSAIVADLQSRYGPDHPLLVKAQHSLADIDNQIQLEIGRVISNLKAQSQVEHNSVASLEASASNARASLAHNTRASVQLDQLISNAAAAQGIYDAFLSRYKEALAKEGAQPTDAKVVSPASLPTSPSSPNPRLDVVIAIVLGAFTGMAAILLTELLSPGVSSAGDVETVFDLPALGELPTLASTLKRRLGRNRPQSPVQYVVDKPLSRFAETFRNLRTSALSSRTGKKVQVIAVTSSLPKEGKTTTTLCLARTMALSGSKVVVVDCDLRQRSMNKLVRTDSNVGLIEVLNGAARLDQALVRDPESSANLLMVSESTFTPRDVFGSEAMATLLTELRSRFDIILLDTPPVLAVADTRILCPSADVVLFLVKWRKTSRKAARAALRMLTTDQIYIGGIVLTQINMREQARSGEGAGNYYRAVDSYYTG
jgi:capsular exopolysaccharide synthesis family protein